MTLNANDVRDEYTASAGQTVFNYTFKIYTSTDLDVYVTPAGQECSDSDLTTAYSVTDVGNEDGGTITLATPASSGDLVTIVSSIPTNRTTDYQNNGDFRPDTVNDDFDRVVSLVKQIDDKANRSLQFPPCRQNVSSLSLPSPNAGNFLRWRQDLSGLENVTINNTGIQAGVSVANYAALRAEDSSTYTDGQVITVTNDGIAGDFVVKTGTVTDNGGTLIVFTDDSNRYAKRVYDGVVNPTWFAVVGDGVADDTSNYNSALSVGGTLDSSALTAIRITGQISFPAGAKIKTSGVPFIVDYTQTGTGAAFVNTGAFQCDQLIAQLTAGNTFRRLINLEQGIAGAELIRAESVDQINNRSANLDGAVQIRNTSKIDRIETENFDNGVVIFNHNNTKIGDIECTSYVRGVFCKSLDGLWIDYARAHTASVNATQDPGNNSILMEGMSNCDFGTLVSEDAGEHGVRIGGDSGEASTDITISVIRSTNPGQCGFKVNTNDNTTCSRLSVGVIQTTDCATGSGTGTNEDPLRLENVRDVQIGQLIGIADDKANCGNDGLYLNNASRVEIGAFAVENPLRAAIYIEDTKGACRDISVNGIKINSCTAGTPIIINSPTEDIQHMRFGVGYMRDVVADQAVVNITANSPTAGVPNAVIFDFDVDVSSWTTPGSVVASDLITSNTTSPRIYNEMVPRP